MMKPTLLIPLLLGMAAGPIAAEEPPPGATGNPAARPGAQPAAAADHHGHGRRGPKPIAIEAAGNARIRFWQPDLESRELTPEAGRVTLPRTGISAYYALVVEWQRPDEKRALIRYEYQNGRPAKNSPSELLAAEKTDLEIVPDPLPREHYRYLSGTRWDFLVRFQGRPVHGAAVILRSAHGTELTATSDVDGRVSFTLPDDFPDVQPGRAANRPAELTLETRYQGPNRAYLTRLSTVYHVNPAHWQSIPWGIGVTAMGLLAGLLVIPGAARNGGKTA